MEILSMQMVAEIAAGLDPIITDFVTNYVTNHAAESKFDPARYEYKQLVHTALSNALSKANDAQSNPLSKAFKAENKYRKGKKERWYASAVKNVSDNDFTSSKHIFSSTIMIYQNSSVKQKEILFGGKSLTDVVNDLLAETQAWSTDAASWLISFPGIQSFSVEKIYDSIISDVFINAFHFIKDHYNGDIRNFKQILPDTMVSFPFFGVKREPLDLKPANNMLVEKLLLADNSIFQTAVTLSNGNTGMIDEPRVQASLDQLDLAFFQYGMFANIDDEFYNSKSVTVPLLNFAKIINERPNKQYLNRAVERLRNYPHKVYSYIDKEHNIVMDEYNLIDRVQIINPSDYVPTDDYPYASDAKVIIYFGDRLYQEIVNEQLTIISRSSAELVSPGLPRLLCPVLQRERTILTLGLDRSKEIDPQMTLRVSDILGRSPAVKRDILSFRHICHYIVVDRHHVELPAALELRDDVHEHLRLIEALVLLHHLVQVDKAARAHPFVPLREGARRDDVRHVAREYTLTEKLLSEGVVLVLLVPLIPDRELYAILVA